MKPAAGRGRGEAPARLHARRGLAVAVVVTGLVIIAAPALAFIAGSAQWPWARDQRGVSLAASVRASGGTATVRLTSRAGLVYRTRGSHPKVLAPVVAKRRRRAVAEPALEAVAVEQRHEELEVLFLAVVRRRRHQQEVPGQRREQLPELVALGVLDLAAEEGGRHLVRFVADDEVPAAVGRLELRLHVLVARRACRAGR